MRLLAPLIGRLTIADLTEALCQNGPINFQRLVVSIHQGLAGDRAVVEESRELRDRVTGTLREVDIVIESAVGDYPVFLCVECCDRSRPATVEWVEQQHGKHATLPTSRIVPFDLSPFGFGTHHVASGGADSDIGDLLLTVLEREGAAPTAVLLRRLGEFTIAETMPGRPVSQADVAPNEAMAALMGRFDEAI